MLLASTVCAHASPPPVVWQQWQHLTGVFDVSGPAPDGSLVAAGATTLSRVTLDGQVTTIDPVYSFAAFAEEYIAVSPGLHLAGPGCDFLPGEVFALRLSPNPAVLRIDLHGAATVLAPIAGVSTLNGITFDTTGRFGNRLLVSGPSGAQTVIDEIDCAGTVSTVTSAAPVLEGGLALAPSGFGAFGGDLVAPDELSGKIYAIAPDGTVTTLATSGLAAGQDIGVESAGFVPAGFSAGGAAYLADRVTPGGAHPGTDTILRLDSSALASVGVQDGDLLVATEGGAATLDVRCSGATCSATHVADGSSVAHGEGHIAFTLTGACQTPPAMPSGGGGGGGTTFHFAEGYTGPGFNECLSMLSPGVSGTADIALMTATGVTTTTHVWLFAGQPRAMSVNALAGPNQQVSARVTLPGPGVVERVMHFSFGQWHGSTDLVGTTQTGREWDFAEGSTLSAFDEFLTIENPGLSAATLQLGYLLEGGGHPTKSLSVPAGSRTTVEVFNGTTSDVTGCVPNGAGASCGVGRGVGGVGVRVTSDQPVVVERPMYVDGHDFGFGPIHDGHVDFGVSSPASSWSFAEGTTLPGFDEYLTLANPGSIDSQVTLTFQDDQGRQTVQRLVVPAEQRHTIEVFSSQLGVGPGIGGVSVQVGADQPILAERPEYVYHDFGSGVVAGAHVATGGQTGILFGFAAASTAAGESDFITLQNPGNQTAGITLTYYTGSGTAIQSLTVPAGTRSTVQVFDTVHGVGSGIDRLGLTVASDQPILAEKPTYGSNADTYGATDTQGYSATSF